MRHRALSALLGAISALSTVSGCSLSATAPPSPRAAVDAVLAQWSAGRWSSLAAAVSHPPADFVAANASAWRTLGVVSAHCRLLALRTDGDEATASVAEALQLVALGRFRITTTVHLVYRRARWLVAWSPATIDPALGADGHFSLSYDWPARAPVLEADGTPISTTPPTAVAIGLYGQYVTNAATLTTSLEAAGATAAEIAPALRAALASPQSFETVFTVSWSRFEQVRAALTPVPGVFFQAEGGSGSTPPALAGVVGSLGAPSATELAALGRPYTADSVVGISGLEQADERQLAGVPGGTISAVVPTAGRRVTRVLARFAPHPGAPVRTTIDPAIEQAATDALANAPGEQAALVALDASTGTVVAVANTSEGGDLALEGELPPGSTMKVITSTALIDKGLGPSSPATCPPVIDVDGEQLHNAGSEGPVSDLMQAFTVSCNTAFIGLTMANLGESDLHAAAATYRIGSPLRIGLPVFPGSVPVNDGQTDLAASAIGQARVVMNPLDLAMVAADVDTSTVRTPYLTKGAPGASEPTAPLPATLDADLKEMMLSVVEEGTAAGTGLPPGTYAKTGTAEYGSGDPLPIDAWLMGFNGDIAFAMVDVDAPGNGGPTDGPIVARFLDAISTG